MSAGSGGPFPRIDRTVVTEESLKQLKSEADFMGVAIDLMIEAGSYITIAANILGPNRTWTRDQAAIGGNMVRLFKLFSAMLDQTVQHRRDTSFILARLAFETIVNIQYLLHEFSPDLVEKYVKHSLDQERRLLQHMDDNIAARSGVILPIEDRMKKSIDRAFRSVQIEPSDLPEKRERDWGGKNLYEKAKAVGLAKAYLGMFAGASQNVHGAWGDLYTHHLDVPSEGHFIPNLEWNRPRPQLLYSIAYLSLQSAAGFARFMGGEEVAAELFEPLEDLERRIRLADGAHEAYLTGKTWPYT